MLDNKFEFSEGSAENSLKKILLDKEHNFTEIFKALEKELLRKRQLPDLFAVLESPPFGIKKGLHLFIILKFILANKHRLIVELEDTFITQFDDSFYQYLTKEGDKINLQIMDKDTNLENIRLLQQYIKFLYLNKDVNELEVAQKLIKQLDDIYIYIYIYRTRRLSDKTQKLLKVLKAAQNPFDLLYKDIPAIFPDNLLDNLTDSFDEIKNFIPNLLKSFQQVIDANFVLNDIKLDNISNLRLKRLLELIKNQNPIIDIINFLARTTTENWTDIVIDNAHTELNALHIEFEKYKMIQQFTTEPNALLVLKNIKGELQIITDKSKEQRILAIINEEN
jgi:hypothetical protein